MNICKKVDQKFSAEEKVAEGVGFEPTAEPRNPATA